MKKRLKAIVVSDKPDKTVIVKVERLVLHPLYKKYIKRHTRLACHDSKNIAKVGSKVIIEATRPMSKTKHWRIVEVESASPSKGRPASPSQGG